MGRYDCVHTGSHCGQVKCLGKGLGNVVIGDVRRLYVIPWGERADEIWDEVEAADKAGRKRYEIDNPIWKLYDGEVSEATAWQIKTQTGYIKFVDNTFVGWDDEPADDLMIVGNDGQDLEVSMRLREWPEEKLGWGKECR